MASTEVGTQPVKDVKTNEMALSPEEEIPEGEVSDDVPEEKSSVYVDPLAPNQSGRFQKRDIVHMSITEGGIRTKGIFAVAKGRLHHSGSYFEYQLKVLENGRPYKDGMWVREKHLKLERRPA